MTALFGLEQDMSTWGEVYLLPAYLLHTHTRAHYVLLTAKYQEFFKVQNPPNLCCIVNSWRLQYKAIVPAIAFELNLKQMVDQVFLSFLIFYFLYIETPDFALAKEEDKQKDKDKVKHDRKEKDKYMGNTKKK